AAEALGRETWEARQRILGPDHRDTLQSLETYAFALANQKKLSQAEPLMRQCFQIRERTLGPLNFDTIDCLGNLAYVLATAGDFARAEQYEREELLRHQKLGLTNRVEALYGLNDLAMYRFLQGQPEDAEKLLLDAHARALRVAGPDKLVTLHIQHVLAR